MFVGDIYKFVIFLRNQGQSRTYAPEEIQAALNRAVLDKWNYEANRFEATGRVTDSMQPFKRVKDIVISGTTFDLPSAVGERYGHYTAAASLVGDVEHPAEYVLTDDEWGEFTRADGLLTPTNEYPVFRIQNDKIQVLPATVIKIRFYYLKLPEDCVIAYNVENDRPVYTDNGSVDPEFPQYDHNALLAQTMKYLGIELRDELLISFDKIHPLKTE